MLDVLLVGDAGTPNTAAESGLAESLRRHASLQ